MPERNFCISSSSSCIRNSIDYENIEKYFQGKTKLKSIPSFKRGKDQDQYEKFPRFLNV